MILTASKGSIAKDGVRFLFFDQIKEAFADPETKTLSPLRNLAAGMTAGVVASITAVTPTERIKTALIDDARNEKRFRSGLHATRVIWKEHGIMGLYRGLAGTTLKQASATAFRMGTYSKCTSANKYKTFHLLYLLIGQTSSKILRRPKISNKTL
jgi:solute carrier family 25 citrate transporter 1